MESAAAVRKKELLGNHLAELTDLPASWKVTAQEKSSPCSWASNPSRAPPEGGVLRPEPRVATTLCGPWGTLHRHSLLRVPRCRFLGGAAGSRREPWGPAAELSGFPVCVAGFEPRYLCRGGLGWGLIDRERKGLSTWSKFRQAAKKRDIPVGAGVLHLSPEPEPRESQSIQHSDQHVDGGGSLVEGAAQTLKRHRL